MADLWARCPDCGGSVLVARLPMEAREVARLARKARCPNACVTPLRLAPPPDKPAAPDAQEAAHG